MPTATKSSNKPLVTTKAAAVRKSHSESTTLNIKRPPAISTQKRRSLGSNSIKQSPTTTLVCSSNCLSN